MSITALTSLAELASNQSLGQNPDTSAGAQSTQSPTPSASALPADSFTSSSQNGSTQATAQDAGLFQVSPLALSSATANILSAQSASPQTTQNAPPAQSVSSGVDSTPPNVLNATVANDQTPVAPTTPAPAAPNQGTLGEPQALNATLLGLGLSNSDIQYIDHIASSINNFDPAIYNNLVQQFQLQLAQQTAAAPAGNTPSPQTKVTEP